MIATGVSELGANTTVKIWEKTVEAATPEEFPPPRTREVETLSKVITSRTPFIQNIPYALPPASFPLADGDSHPSHLPFNGVLPLHYTGWDGGGNTGKVQCTIQCLEGQSRRTGNYKRSYYETYVALIPMVYNKYFASGGGLQKKQSDENSNFM